MHTPLKSDAIMKIVRGIKFSDVVCSAEDHPTIIGPWLCVLVNICWKIGHCTAKNNELVRSVI